MHLHIMALQSVYTCIFSLHKVIFCSLTGCDVKLNPFDVGCVRIDNLVLDAWLLLA